MTEKRTTESAPVDHTAVLTAALADLSAAQRTVNVAVAHLIAERVLALHPEAKSLEFAPIQTRGLSNSDPILVAVLGDGDKCLAYQFNRADEPDFLLFHKVNLLASNFGPLGTESSVLNRRSDGQYILNLDDFA